MAGVFHSFYSMFFLAADSMLWSGGSLGHYALLNTYSFMCPGHDCACCAPIISTMFTVIGVTLSSAAADTRLVR